MSHIYISFLVYKYDQIICNLVGPRKFGSSDRGFTGIGPNFTLNSPGQVQQGPNMPETFQGI
jgi:hypothetical protein